MSPPETVKGLTELSHAAFTKVITVPAAKVSVKHVQQVLAVLRDHYLKLSKFQPVVEHPDDSQFKAVYLNPKTYEANKEIIHIKLTEVCEKVGLESVDELVTFCELSVELSYNNWNAEEILRAVLPLDNDVATGYSIIGHILHLNLRDHVLPYKKVIGQVLLDKTRATLIINKLDNIDCSDNTFRSFNMEVF